MRAKMKKSVLCSNEVGVDLLTTLRKEEKEKDLQTSWDRPQTYHPTPSAMYVEEASPDAVRYHLSQCNHHDAGGTSLKEATSQRQNKVNKLQDDHPSAETCG